MSLLVGLILTALNGPIGTESRGVAGFANFDIAPLKDLEPTFDKPKFQTQIIEKCQHRYQLHDF
jgi:hypothetical protein